MTTITTRRAILAGIASAPALTASITALAAVSVPDVAKAPTIDPDAELRRLWSKYCAELEAYHVAEQAHRPRRDAVDRDMKPFDVSHSDYSAWGGWQGWNDARQAAFKKAWRKHKVGGVWRTLCKQGRQCRATIAAIRSIEARTPFGVGIKLVALPADRGYLSKEDYEDALRAALPDLDKLCGGTFAGTIGDEVSLA